MYQYKAILKSTNEIISEGHSIEELEKDIVRFRRGQKYNKHTDSNVGIEIIHVKRDQKTGNGREELIKVV